MKNNLKKLSIVGARMSALLGLIVLFGWYTHNEILIQFSPSFVPMQYNTALGFLLCGLGIFFIDRKNHNIGVACGSLVLLLGLLTLLEYILGLEFGIDQFLMEHYLAANTSHPGRMPANTALCFSLAGIALILVSINKVPKNHSLLIGISGSLILGIAIIALSSYMVRLKTDHGWNELTFMAIHTALGFIILGITILAIAWLQELKTLSHLPSWLPILIGIGVMTIIISLWQAQESHKAYEVKSIQNHNSSGEQSLINQALLMAGIIFSLAIALTTYLAQSARSRAQELLLAKDKLESEIHERKRIEHALRLSEEQFRLAISLAPAPTMLHAEDGEIIQINKIWTEITGYDPNDIPTLKDWTAKAYGEEMDNMCEYIESIFDRNTKDHDGEFQVRTKSGEYRHWDFASSPLSQLPDGRRLIISMATDITERKLAEETIHENTERLRAIYDQSNDAILLLDFENEKIIDFNQMAVTLLGYPPNELVGLSIKDIHPYDMDRFQHFASSILEHGTGSTEELTCLTKERSYIPVEISASPIQIKGKVYLLALVRDISKRNQVLQALRDSQENLQTILNSLGDAVIATDTHGNVTQINPIAQHLTGWRLDEVKGKKLSLVFKIINRETRKIVESPVDRVLLTGKSLELANHIILIAKDGTEHLISDTAALIADDKGNVSGVVLVFRDVTEQYQLEEELLKTRKLKSVGVLAGGIAHNFNNIFTGLFGNIELAKMKLPENHPVYHHLEIANQELDRAKNLTNQLLTFAKGGEPLLEVIDFSNLLQDSIKFNLTGSSVKPHFDISDNLWHIKADKGQLAQVLANLVLNTKQAMTSSGNVYITAKNVEKHNELLSHDFSGKYVKFIIRDEGCGIKPADLEKIFDPYFTTKENGSGLGLATVHSIIKKHSGHIRVNSKYGVGTTFSFYLPANIPSDLNLPTPTSNSKTKTPLVSGYILVMDDDDMVRDLTSEMLISLGYNVDTAINGEEAINKYIHSQKLENPFDIIIMDLTIPGGMGGKKAIEKILEINDRAKVIVSSGYSIDPVMANYQSYGFKGRIAKPFKREEISQELARVINLA